LTQLALFLEVLLDLVFEELEHLAFASPRLLLVEETCKLFALTLFKFAVHEELESSQVIVPLDSLLIVQLVPVPVFNGHIAQEAVVLVADLVG